MAPVLEDLGRATAKVHCVSDEDSDQDLVTSRPRTPSQNVVDGRQDEFVDEMVDFGIDYAEAARADQRCS